MKRTVLIASPGMILTDGEIYGTMIFLAEERSAEEFYEIPLEEYETLMEQEGQSDGSIKTEG